MRTKAKVTAAAASTAAWDAAERAQQRDDAAAKAAAEMVGAGAEDAWATEATGAAAPSSPLGTLSSSSSSSLSAGLAAGRAPAWPLAHGGGKDFVGDAVELLIDCRAVLAMTFVWAFFETDEATRVLFEHTQKARREKFRRGRTRGLAQKNNKTKREREQQMHVQSGKGRL